MKALKLLVVALAATPLIASASIDLVGDSKLTYGMDLVYGVTNTPNPAAPAGGWLIATFENKDANTVTLTLNPLGIGSGEFVTDWAFNFTPGKALSFSVTTNPTSLSSSSNIVVAPDSLNLTSTGLAGFDLKFHFPGTTQPGAFVQGEKFVVDISAVGGLKASDFLLPTLGNASSNPPAFYSAVELAGIASYHLIADLYPSEGGSGGAIPEPSTYAGLAGLAVLGLALWRRQQVGLYA